MASDEKFVLIACGLIMLFIYPFMIMLAIKGEKRMVKAGFIKGFFFWPDVHGAEVPIVARKYKFMIILYSTVAFVLTIYFVLSSL